MGKPFISVSIPVENKTPNLAKALKFLAKQTYQNFEVIISTSDLFSSAYSFVQIYPDRTLSGDVASKRNQILKYGKGEIFVFNDDDVFSPPQYLENIVETFKNPTILAACGPLLTPPTDSFMQQASGVVWEGYLGSMGAGIYRSRRLSPQFVYDYPAANLIVKAEVFQQIGGFQTGIFPGEDTKLCLDIYKRFNTGIYYKPNLFVYHSRKPLFTPHLAQIGRYGNQRGWFALAYPETSFKLQYFLPSLLLLYILGFAILSVRSILVSNFALVGLASLPLLVYAVFVIIEAIRITYQKGIRIAGLAIVGVIATHLYYGYRFLKSFVSKLIRKLIDK